MINIPPDLNARFDTLLTEKTPASHLLQVNDNIRTIQDGFYIKIILYFRI
ncbi:MAG: hypothetical protein AABZ36_08110 [Nitrospirota bacterium]